MSPALPLQGTCGRCETGYSLKPPFAKCRCGEPRDVTPWGDAVPPVQPLLLERIAGQRAPSAYYLAGCPSCTAAGHICRPCRKVRYQHNQRRGDGLVRFVLGACMLAGIVILWSTQL